MKRTLADEARRRKPVRSRRGLRLPRLVLMTDRRRLDDPLAAAAKLPLGSAVVLRDQGWPGRVALGTALRALCRRRRLIFLVAGDERLALRLGADGVHWPQASLRTRRRSKRWCYVSAAVHDAAAATKARRAKVDFILVSPVFPTRSHPTAWPLGPVRFAALASRARIPIIALGGIDGISARRLGPSAVNGFAAIGALDGTTN